MYRHSSSRSRTPCSSSRTRWSTVGGHRHPWCGAGDARRGRRRPARPTRTSRRPQPEGTHETAHQSEIPRPAHRRPPPSWARTRGGAHLGSATTSERRRTGGSTFNSARTGRWSEPAWGSTSPATGCTAPRTKMWSIWLCGRHVGQVAPDDRPAPPGHEAAAPVGPTCSCRPPARRRAGPRSRSWRRSSAQLRCEPKWRCDMWVPATEIGLAVDREVDHHGGPAHPVRPQQAQVARAASPRSAAPAAPARRCPTSPARPPASGPWLCTLAGMRPHAVDVERLVALRPDRPGRSSVGRRRAGVGCAAPRRVCACHDLVAERRAASARPGPPSVVPLGRPGLLEHDDVGVAARRSRRRSRRAGPTRPSRSAC